MLSVFLVWRPIRNGWIRIEVLSESETSTSTSWWRLSHKNNARRSGLTSASELFYTQQLHIIICFNFVCFIKRPFYNRFRRVARWIYFEREVEDGSGFLYSSHRLQPLDRRHSRQRPLLQPRLQTQTSRSHRQRRWRQNVFSRKAFGRWQRTVCDQVGDQTLYIICSCLARLRLRLEKVF